jgi:hypothetical protein
MNATNRDALLPAMRGARAALGMAGLLAVLAGCATTGGVGGLVPTRADRPSTPAAQNPVNPAANDPATAGSDAVPVPGVTPVPAPGEVVGGTASGGAITRRAPVAAPVDSGPSADAHEVLATIPDPIPAGERVTASARVQQLYPLRDATPGIAMAADSSGAPDMNPAAPADSAALEAGAVPVPEPTLPLGQRRPQTIPTIPDSVVRAVADSAMRTPGTALPASSPTTPTAPAVQMPVSPDSCWRVQVSAPEEADRAEQLRAASESLLLAPMVVEKEQGLYKVRTRDCMSAETAGRLRDRAETTGFAGAFRFKKKP